MSIIIYVYDTTHIQIHRPHFTTPLLRPLPSPVRMIANQREPKMGGVIGGSSSSRDVTELADMMDALLKIGPFEISIRPVKEGTPFQFLASDYLLAIMGSREPVVKAYLLEKAGASNHDIVMIDKEPTTKQQNINNDDDDNDWESCPCNDDVDVDIFKHDKRPISIDDVKGRTFLEVAGHIQGYNTKTNTLWVGGDVPCVDDLVNITTNCKRVLLAVNNHTWEELLRYVAKHLDDYVVVRVGWDTSSYCFLRKLAQCVPDLTFIAVTGLDNHNLALLSFLDTPPNELLTDWRAGVSQDSTVNLKWLGLRPSDIDTYGACFEAHSWKQCQSDFQMVNDQLLSDPSFCRKEAWKAELKRLRDHPIFMPFLFINPNRGTSIDSNYIHNEYLEDWV